VRTAIRPASGDALGMQVDRRARQGADLTRLLRDFADEARA
jgi:hypothetical protein